MLLRPWQYQPAPDEQVSRSCVLRVCSTLTAQVIREASYARRSSRRNALHTGENPRRRPCELSMSNSSIQQTLGHPEQSMQQSPETPQCPGVAQMGLQTWQPIELQSWIHSQHWAVPATWRPAHDAYPTSTMPLATAFPYPSFQYPSIQRGYNASRNFDANLHATAYGWPYSWPATLPTQNEIPIQVFGGSDMGGAYGEGMDIEGAWEPTPQTQSEEQGVEEWLYMGWGPYHPDIGNQEEDS